MKQQSTEKKHRLWDRWRVPRRESSTTGSAVDAVVGTRLDLDAESPHATDPVSPTVTEQEMRAEAEPTEAEDYPTAPETDARPDESPESEPEPDLGPSEDPEPEADPQPEPDPDTQAEQTPEPTESPNRSAFHVEQPDDATVGTTFGRPAIGDSPIARELADLTARQRTLDQTTVQLTGRTRVITVSNQKGGVGKTTSVVNLAAALATAGARVLVIDLDPQGNASTALSITHTADTPSIYDVLIDEFPMADIIQTSPESELLTCAPSTIHLAGAEIELVSQVAREHRLRTALETYVDTVEDKPDFVLIDCPPSLGLLTINAFTAADEVLIPIQCEYYALEGLSQLLGNVRMIQKHLNQKLRVSTILLTMYDARTRLAQQVADEVRAHFPSEVLTTVIPRSVRVSEAPSFGQTVIAYDGQSAGAVAYREAAVEIIQRENAAASKEGGA